MPILLAPLLSVLTSKWLWTGIAVAASIAGIAWLRHDASSAKQEAAELRSSIEIAKTANAQNVLELARVRQSEASARAAIASVKAIADRRAADLAAIRKKVNATRDDSSCGPAVAAALDGLRNRAAASRKDPNRGSSPAERDDKLP